MTAFRMKVKGGLAMKKRMNSLTVLILATLALTVFFAGSVFAADKIIMRVATPTSNDPQTHEMDLFKKAVESNSQGKIEVQLFPSCQLGSNAQMLQGLQAGTIHGLLEPTAFLGGFSDVLTLIDLPYFFENVWTASDLLNSPAGDSLRAYLEGRGLVAAAFYPYGDRNLLLKFPVANMDDFKGKKIRVMGAKVLQNEIKAWGGAGIPMDVPELYTALQQGVIDGLESAAQFFYMLKYFQVAGYIFTEPQGAEVTIFMMNKKWLEQLPADLREVVLKGAKEIIPAATEFSRTTEKDAMDKMKAAGVKVLDASPEFKQKLKNASMPVHDTFLKENQEAKPIYEGLKKAMAK
jgi:tripartite ATP-independent transporter DctP family solute receptor